MTRKQILIGAALWLGLITFVLAIPYLPYDSKRQVRALFLDDSAGEHAYVFFGFSACADVCPTSLALLRNIMQQAKESNVVPQVVFVDIDLNSNATLAENYAEQFHPNFVGFYPNQSQRTQLIADFGLNIRQKNANIQHSGRTFLLRKEAGKWWIIKTFNPQSVSEPLLLNSLT
jgi:cytochrome oxidase Cu insertion factor (SCO1/SenC/PrrC family)